MLCADMLVELLLTATMRNESHARRTLTTKGTRFHPFFRRRRCANRPCWEASQPTDIHDATQRKCVCWSTCWQGVANALRLRVLEVGDCVSSVSERLTWPQSLPYMLATCEVYGFSCVCVCACACGFRFPHRRRSGYNCVHNIYNELWSPVSGLGGNPAATTSNQHDDIGERDSDDYYVCGCL